ncbi:hypothetical protein ACFYT4_17850 [Streptomyces sp. NPDC004609]|uniref:hypothetical protein n=1 Tax=Streptomyces sp. NPDC004609 TaxID=3364704 RepID=UPI00369903D6
MNKASRTPLNGSEGAVHSAPQMAMGELKVVARKGVLSVVGSDLHLTTAKGRAAA